MFGATEQKNLLNKLAISSSAVRKLSLSFTMLGVLESLQLKKLIDFMSFHVFLMFLTLILK